jgi:hypothetical protein
MRRCGSKRGTQTITGIILFITRSRRHDIFQTRFSGAIDGLVNALTSLSPFAILAGAMMLLIFRHICRSGEYDADHPAGKPFR